MFATGVHSMTTDLATQVIATLRAHAKELRAAGVRHLSLFGPAVRDQAAVDSDIDLVAELDPTRGSGCLPSAPWNTAWPR